MCNCARLWLILPASVTRFLFLPQHAKEVLCDVEKRSNYDKWRRSGIAISYKQWLGMKDSVHQVGNFAEFTSLGWVRCALENRAGNFAALFSGTDEWR